MKPSYPPRLKLAQLPTPLEPLDRLSADMGGPRIWIKRDDLSGCATSGNKVRKLEFTLAEALNQGCDAVITCGGLQSNHCRTTALLAARLGLKAHLILRGEKPEKTADGNLLLDELSGAQISYYSAGEYQRRLPQLMQDSQQDFAERGHKAWIIPTGASDGIGVWGYIHCCQELSADFQAQSITPSHIISATGSGGTLAGLTAGNALYQLGTTVWGINVCDDADYFKRKVHADLQEWQDNYQQALDVDSLPVNIIDGYVGPGYAQASEEVFNTIKLLAHKEGVLLDPVYTGKAFHAMLQELKNGRFGDKGDIVFIHTGGLFGLFAQRDQLLL